MITKKDVTGLEFETINQYYEYIVESYINGNKFAAKDLFLKGTKDQRKTFFGTLEEMFYLDTPYEHEKRKGNKTFEVFNFFWNLL